MMGMMGGMMGGMNNNNNNNPHGRKKKNFMYNFEINEQYLQIDSNIFDSRINDIFRLIEYPSTIYNVKTLKNEIDKKEKYIERTREIMRNFMRNSRPCKNNNTMYNNFANVEVQELRQYFLYEKNKKSL